MGVTFNELIDNADALLVKLCAPKDGESLDEHIPAAVLKKARGVAFFFTYTVSAVATVSGGHGLVIGKKPGTDEWALPIAVGLGGVGAGIAVGVHKEYQILILTSDEAVASMCTKSFKLGAEMNMAQGVTGQSHDQSTYFSGDSKVDAIVYGTVKGASIGTSIQTAVVDTEDQANAAYYGVPLPTETHGPKPLEIVQGTFPPLMGKTTPRVAKLQEHLTKSMEGPLAPAEKPDQGTHGMEGPF